MHLVFEPQEIDPHSEGWKRHAILERTWIMPDGRLYKFAKDQKEVLLVPRAVFGVPTGTEP